MNRSLGNWLPHIGLPTTDFNCINTPAQERRGIATGGCTQCAWRLRASSHAQTRHRSRPLDVRRSCLTHKLTELVCRWSDSIGGVTSMAHCNHLQSRATWGAYAIGISMHVLIVVSSARFRASVVSRSGWLQIEAKIASHTTRASLRAAQKNPSARSATRTMI